MTIDSGIPIRGTPLPPLPSPATPTNKHTAYLCMHEGRKFVRYCGPGVDDIFEVSKFIVKHSKFRAFDVYIGRGYVCVSGVSYI